MVQTNLNWRPWTVHPMHLPMGRPCHRLKWWLCRFLTFDDHVRHVGQPSFPLRPPWIWAFCPLTSTFSTGTSPMFNNGSGVLDILNMRHKSKVVRPTLCQFIQPLISNSSQDTRRFVMHCRFGRSQVIRHCYNWTTAFHPESNIPRQTCTKHDI